MAQINDEATRTVAAALEALYNNPAKEAKDAANTWLQEFQHTKEAWGTSNLILLTPDAPLPYKLFAAQTFRTKVTYDLSQLVQPERIALKDTLLVALRLYATGPRVILTQICLALAGLALQLPDWQGVVTDLIDAYGQDLSTVNALLEFLAVLPDEVNSNHRIPISNDEFRERAAALLSDNSTRVLDLLSLYISSQGVTEEIQTKTFECVRSWISYGEVSPLDFGQSPLLPFAFDALDSEALFDTAVEVICDLIHETQEITDNMPVIQVIVPRVVLLRPRVASAKEDPEKLRGFCKIFAETGETYRQLVVQHPDTFFPIVEAIAECAACDDLDIVPITFPFWYRLATTLGKLQRIPQPFLQVYQGLVDVVIKHLHFPPEDSGMTPQEWDDFRSFRHVMGDTLKDCCGVLGVDTCLSRALEHVTTALSQGASANWQAIEAPLFSMRSMGAEVDLNEDVVIPRIMDLLPNLPDHFRVRYAALLLIGRYTEWINHHPQYIPYLMTYMSASFGTGNIEVSAAAGQTMKYLCKDCKQHLVPYLPQLHTFLQTMGSQLAQDDAVQMYEAVAWVLTSMPVPDAARTLSEFCLPLISIVHAVGQRPEEVSRDELKPVADALENLDALMRVMTGFGDAFPPECLNTPAQVWPVLDTLVARYGSTYFISERVCTILRRTLQVMPLACLSVVPSVAIRLCTSYEQTGFSGYLWICGKLIDTFWETGGMTVSSTLATAVERQNIKTIQLLKDHSPESLQDVLEDYMHVMLQVMDHMPDSLYLSPSFPQIFEVALAGLTVMQADVNMVAIDFIRAMLNNKALQNAALEPNVRPLPYATSIRSVIENYALQMLGILLTGMMDHYVEDATVGIVGILRIIATLWQGQLLAWLQPILGQIPDNLVPAEAKAAFFAEMTNALGSQGTEKVKNAVLGLYRASRRLQERRRAAMARR